MNRASLAEWIFSLMMPPERAAAAVGDLLEFPRSPLTFWTSILSTVVLTTWRTVSEHPVNAAAMIAQIYRRYLKLVVLFYIPFLIFVLAWTATIHRLVPNTLWDWTPAVVEAIGVSLVVPVLLGRSLMREHANHGISSALAFSSCIVLLELALWILGGTFRVPSGIEMSFWSLLFPPPAIAVLLVAAIAERRKQLRLGVASA